MTDACDEWQMQNKMEKTREVQKIKLYKFQTKGTIL